MPAARDQAVTSQFLVTCRNKSLLFAAAAILAPCPKGCYLSRSLPSFLRPGLPWLGCLTEAEFAIIVSSSSRLFFLSREVRGGLKWGDFGRK